MLKDKGKEQQKAGQPLGTGGERVDVIKAKAEAAQVGTTTAKKVERVRKANPKAVADIAAGATTANKELKKLRKKKKVPMTTTHTGEQKAGEPFEVGDTIYRVAAITVLTSLYVTIYGYTVEAVGKKTYLSSCGKRIAKEDALTLDTATKRRQEVITQTIGDLETELSKLKEELQQEPVVEWRRGR